MAMRILEIVFSGGGLFFLFPLFLSILIKIDSPGPVFYRAVRVGKGGKLFRLYKFRSMVANAEQIGPGITASGDNRITRVGKSLRRYKLDELPQLINVFKGEMSLVEPWPEDPRYVELYTPEQQRLLSVKPGITSAASLKYRDEESLLTGQDWEERYCGTLLPDKLAIELEYLNKRSPWKDLMIIVRTVIASVKNYT